MDFLPDQLGRHFALDIDECHTGVPVILSREMERFWLDRSVQDPAAIGSILSPYPADAMELYEVSTLVNSYANDGPEIIEPVPYS